MQLKRLELVGFKSFANKTEFEFGPGITALVGPNGCGKSNVVDAIKWILGEQSVKSLRGKEMADVIFNGVGTRKSLGFAEATLVMDNRDGRLSVGTHEVSVTRRVYRSGEGEYFINKKPCRLKDIKNLFLDTGIGVECYSVIEQGRIDRILQASTTERREVFDEAAGISKYKARRKEATAKLERTQANLLRVNDIIEEVGKQLRSVKYQAAKARRYREYSDELKKLRVSYSLNDYDGLTGRLHERQGQEEGLSRRQMGLQTQRHELEAERSEVETGLTTLENRLEEMQRQLGELQARVAAGSDAVHVESGRADEQAELRGKYEQQRQLIAGRTEQMQGDLAARLEQLERARVQSAEQETALVDRQQRLTGLLEQESALARSLEGYKAELIGLMQEAARLSNELSVVGSDLRNVNAQLGRLNVRMTGLEAERLSNEQEHRSLQTELGAVEEVLARLDEQRAERRRERNAAHAQMERLDGELEQTRQEWGAKRSRLEVLEDLDAKFEGVEQGVKAVLEKARSGEATLAGVLGMLGEGLQVRDGHATAVEAALGHRAQTVIVGETGHADQALSFVKERTNGRASFLPLSEVCEHGDASHPSLEGREGVLGRLRDFIHTENGTTKVLDRLLEGFYLVSDLERARQLRREGTNGHTLVTVDGEVIEPNGIITGGRGIAGGGLITRWEERRRLTAELEVLGAQIAGLEQDLTRQRETVQGLDAEVARLEALMIQSTQARQAKQHGLERVQEKQKRLEDETGVIGSEHGELAQDQRRLTERESQVRQQLEGVEDSREEINRRIETLATDLRTVTARRVAASDEVTELKVDVARCRQLQEGLEMSVVQLERELEGRQEESERLAAEIEGTHQRERDAKEAAELRRRQLEELRLQERALSERLTQENAGREEQRNHIVEIDDRARGLRAELTQVEETMGQVRLAVQECRLKMENAVARVREEYGLDLVELHKGYQPEQMNWEEVGVRIEELRTKLQNMGSVNLEAINDEESLQQRLDFLTGQKADLESATRQLEEIIRKINKACKEQFETSFALIRGHFQDIFRKLFGGGKADLFLEDETNMLESGIEIIARPPGKEPRALTLLSGGEKVMTAVALLFAIFKAKPSPFCILDEVDAALDEANIGRFCSIIQEFLDQSQFIIITHSKRTMSVADVLYGITMQEAGMSKKVTVKFEEYEQQVA